MQAIIERLSAVEDARGLWVDVTLETDDGYLMGTARLYRLDYAGDESVPVRVTCSHGPGVDSWADDDLIAWIDEDVSGYTRRIEQAVAYALTADPLLRALVRSVEAVGLPGLASVAGTPGTLVEQAAALLDVVSDAGELRAALADRVDEWNVCEKCGDHAVYHDDGVCR